MPFLGTVYFIYESHDANQEIQKTQLVSAHLRLIADFSYLPETF